jgi:hypothetical protein
MGPRKAPLVALALLGSAAAFASISEDGEFKVSADFALAVMKELGCDTFLENSDYKPGLESAYAEYDTDGDGLLNLTELIAYGEAAPPVQLAELAACLHKLILIDEPEENPIIVQGRRLADTPNSTVTSCPSVVNLYEFLNTGLHEYVKENKGDVTKVVCVILYFYVTSVLTCISSNILARNHDALPVYEYHFRGGFTIPSLYSCLKDVKTDPNIIVAFWALMLVPPRTG